MDNKAKNYKVIRGNFGIKRDPETLTNKGSMTYDELIKVLDQNGFIEVKRTSGHVFLRHEQSGSVITLPTQNRAVRGPHLAATLKVLRDIQK